jgi:23S rRNA-/tRNA-specific pseudouridylate synthase
VTSYRTLEFLPGFSYLEVDLVTGRTHQIRVHFQSLLHPVIGDTRYGGQPWRNLRDPVKRAAIQGFHRLALHAARISLAHPVTGERLEIEAPLPAEFEALLATLGKGA